MGSRSRLAALCLLGLGLALGTGCAVPEGPELLEVSSASPSLLESGGALLVSGRGFPAGRTGQIELVGTTLVPGRDPERVKARWSGKAASSGRLVAALNDQQLTDLAGGAAHATFRGRLSVAFEPVRPGAPVLRGHIQDVTLDVLSSVAPLAPAADFADYLGLGLGSDLTVVSAVEGLEAHAAGLRVGDRLHRLDGVTLLTLSDFAPRAHGATSLLEYSRPGYAGRAEVLLARSGYFRSDEAVIWLAVSVGIAALLGLLAAARPPRLAVWLLQTGRRGAFGAKRTGALRVGWFGTCVRALVWSAALLFLARGGRSRLPLDLPLLAGASLGALLLAALLATGHRPTKGFSLSTGLWGACLSALGLLPLVLAWGLAAVEMGSLSLVELATAQADAPLGAGVLASPWALLSAGAYLMALVPVAGERAATGSHPERAPWVHALEELGLGLALSIWVVLYGGGLGSLAAPGFAFAVCFAELCLVWTGLYWLRAVSGRASRGESWEVLVWPVVASSLAAALVRLLVLRFELMSLWEAELRWLPLLCLLSLGTWLALSALRSLSHRGRRADPWL